MTVKKVKLDRTVSYGPIWLDDEAREASRAAKRPEHPTKVHALETANKRVNWVVDYSSLSATYKSLFPEPPEPAPHVCNCPHCDSNDDDIW